MSKPKLTGTTYSMFPIKYAFVIFNLCFIFFLFSCSRNADKSTDKSNNNSIIVDVTKEDKVSIKDFFDKIDIIPLETTKESMISKADKVLLHENNYYVLDTRQKSIIVFDENGKFKFKIHKVGHGPEEYIDINDFVINNFDQTLEAISQRGQVLKYDLQGKFINSFNLPSPIRAVHYMMPVTKDIIVLYSGYEKDRLSFYSRSRNKVIKQTRTVPDFVSKHTSLNPLTSPFFTYNNTVCYFEPFSNNVYKVLEDDIKLKYSWDFGKYNFDFTKLPTDKPRTFYLNEVNPKSDKYALNFMYNIEDNQHIFTTFIFNKKWKNLIYDKKLKTSQVFSSFSEGITFPILQFYEDGIFTFINPMHLNFLVNEGVLDSDNVKKMKSIKIEDNTVILKYHLKK